MVTFNRAFGGGVQIGSNLADVFQRRRDRRELDRLGQLFGENQDFNALASGLISLGQPGVGVNAAQVPMRQQRLDQQQEFAQQQFLANQAQRAFQNDLATRKFDLSEQQLAQQGQGGFTKPIQAVDADGNPVFIQANEAGNVQAIEGFTPNNPIKTIDTGTETVIVDSRTGQVIDRKTKQNFQEAFDTSRGRETGKQAVESSGDVSKAKENLAKVRRIIGDLKAHPGAQNALGVIQGQLSPMLAASAGLLSGQGFNPQQIANFRAIQNQLEGDVFMNAFESLKGAGQITEVEGEKATQSLLAAQSTQSPEEFFRQLDIFTREIEKGVRLAQERNARLTPQNTVGPAIEVANPNQQVGTKDNPVGVGSEAEAMSMPVGTFVILNGEVFERTPD